MWLIVGLGNPGAQYELTRHNIGFLAIDALASAMGIITFKEAFFSDTAKVSIKNESCLLEKPQTFMNCSGKAVASAMSFYKPSLDHVMVIHDDLDLPLGEIRIKLGGGSGGHNGLKDITQNLGEGYVRIRLGIGRPKEKGTEADFVLSRFSDAELKLLPDIFSDTNNAIETLISEGLPAAQQKCQKKPVLSEP
jgi:PTH1 family peptidyl-tRNA hydrolase